MTYIKEQILITNYKLSEIILINQFILFTNFKLSDQFMQIS